MSDSFYSVGIDIGTTTTHMVVSRLSLDNASKLQEAPRLKISQKTIVYAGDIRFTPMLPTGMIDADAIHTIIANEYRAADIDPQEIQAGALIVTGESAKLRNAEQVAHALSSFAGNFVVASAGPNLESIMAARGSGAVAESKRSGKTICNADIGGGTVNCVVISAGEIIANACLAIGGRCVRVDANGIFVGATDSAKLLLPELADLSSGQRLPARQLKSFASEVANSIFDFITGGFSGPAELIASGSSPFDLERVAIDEFWISGGVGELMSESWRERLQNLRVTSDFTSYDQLCPFGDLGLLIGEALIGKFEKADLRYSVPEQSIRATVIGAGLHSLQLTGSTIAADCSNLPIRNVPLIRLNVPPDSESPESLYESLEHGIVQQLSLSDLDWSTNVVGIHIGGLKDCSFPRAAAIAKALSSVILKHSPRQPYVMVLSNDFAAAFGLLLKKHLDADKILVIDGVDVGDSDFIDIGLPIVHSKQGIASIALPVVVKSLVLLN